MNAIRRSAGEELWRHTRDPMRFPLLLKLQKEKVLFQKAVTCFAYILKYMGDQARGKVAINTDLIFGPVFKIDYKPDKHDREKEEMTGEMIALLKDEIYCQIMRQLTDNPIAASEERGWDLMWLATGVMKPSTLLLKELIEFLRTRHHPVAVESLQRLRTTLRVGERIRPPHSIEVDAIRSRNIKIYHRIYFPNDTDEAFELDSSTKSKDLVAVISKRLELKSSDGFALFVRCMDHAFSIPEEMFIFDFITECASWVRENYPTRRGDSDIRQEIFFLKKLWINVQPGRDLNADHVFYYYQEIQKYLKGYYKLTKSEATKMASIIYRIKYGTGSANVQTILDSLEILLPEDLRNIMKPKEWKSLISSACNDTRNLTVEEGMDEFLKEISKQQTFGSTFFVVKQTNEPNYPSTILIAINQHGFNIIDPESKVFI